MEMLHLGLDTLYNYNNNGTLTFYCIDTFQNIVEEEEEDIISYEQLEFCM